MAPDKPYPETDSKAGLLESGSRPAKWPFIQWLYALMTISAELALTSGASQVSISSMRPPVVKLLFRFTRWLLLWSSIELVASLNVRPVFASNELLSVLAAVCQTPDAVFALRRLGKRRG
jgi:hypothetical protein